MSTLTPYGKDQYNKRRGTFTRVTNLPLPLYSNAPMIEEQRLKNIERNKQLLADFGIDKAREEVAEVHAESATPTPSAVKVRNATKAKSSGVKRKQPIERKQRKSSRLRGIEAPSIEVNDNDQVDNSNMQDDNDNEDEEDVEGALWDGKLLAADAYFDKEIRGNAVRTDGKFKGWVNPELIKKYQLEESAQDAWEKNGGGKFSYKDPLGTGIKTKTGGNGRNSARAIAQMMFKKNPNMYFYRHNEPGVEQWTGDWTEEEKDLFMKVAQEHGCGDKWGLFASYIPHRVGYQCSNHYRSTILPSGLVFDDNYEYTPSGKPIYVGPHGIRSGN
ncbi:hypothetical protein [Absidia glauca]|uniref:Myb-like domain-containing protein n=1 Tax=Absidia glauca TaxID=4829 RepID=A0A163JLF3_ABSGL|nr:hypothetical protein [Absidia glauca]